MTKKRLMKDKKLQKLFEAIFETYSKREIRKLIKRYNKKKS